jgi:N-acylneuraminate cytidylyltransferase
MGEETFHELDEPVDFVIIEKFLESRAKSDALLAARAKRVKLFLSDVDGVLTDSGMYYSEAGDELKKFNTRDGKGFELLRNAGLEVGIITAEKTALVERRAAKLKLNHLIQGAPDKVESLRALLATTGYTPDEVAFVGDDLGDIGIFGTVGFAACPSDAVDEARSVVHYQASAVGGGGVIREVAELVLRLRG